MSFRCEICGEAQETGTPTTPVVIERRDQSYVNRIKREDNNGKMKTIEINSEGWEIVKEKKACATCWATHSVATEELIIVDEKDEVISTYD